MPRSKSGGIPNAISYTFHELDFEGRFLLHNFNQLEELFPGAQPVPPSAYAPRIVVASPTADSMPNERHETGLLEFPGHLVVCDDRGQTLSMRR